MAQKISVSFVHKDGNIFAFDKILKRHKYRTVFFWACRQTSGI